jgi:hypothetical protein
MKPSENHIAEEPEQGFAHISEEQKLLIEIKKSGVEKLQSFTKMLRRNKIIKKSPS